jgi:F-type H+-transporting ATPase subunit O
MQLSIITSAEALTPAQLKTVQAAVQQSVPQGKTVLMGTVVDPSIMDVLQVQLGDQYMDLSIQSRIEKIARMPLE